MKPYLVPIWLLLAPAFGFSSARHDANISDAERWAQWAVSLATDPNLAKISFAALQEKLGNSVHLEREGDGIWSSRNPSNGILSFRLMFWTEKNGTPSEFDQFVVVMPVADAHGNRLFPLIREGIRHRLRPPVWKFSEKRDHCYWGRRNNPLNVIVDEGDFAETEGPLPAPPPYVILIVNKDDPNGD